MMTHDFATEFARIRTPTAHPDRWLALWTEHLAQVKTWSYRHPDGAPGRFKPSGLTSDLLAQLLARADDEGFAEVGFSSLAQALDVEDPAKLGSHVRALRHLGAVERYLRPGAVSRWRLAYERLPDA